MFRFTLRGLVAATILLAAIAAPLVCLAALPDEVLTALEANRLGNASEQQRALLFQHNRQINQARLNGWITDGDYQAAQKDFAALNQQFAESASKGIGEFNVQKSKPGATIAPGTDSDYIIKLTSSDPVGDVSRMQGRYNTNVNAWLSEKLGPAAAGFQPRTDWHNQLDVDFMADPRHVTQKQFEEIAKLNNDAYKRLEAAEFERLSRAGDGSKISPELFQGYAQEMQDFITKKQDLLDKMRQNPSLRSDPALRAEFHRLMAQEQKYIDRIDSANARLRAQEGLSGGSPKEPVYEITIGKDGNAHLRRRSETIASRGAVRSPDNFGTTAAASALAENSSNRAISQLAQSMAEAGQKNPAAWAAAADNIAAITAKLSDAEKGRLIERLKNLPGGDDVAKSVADAMRRQAGIPTSGITGTLSKAAAGLDARLSSALGVSNDLSRMGDLRRTFNEEASRALGGLDNIGKLGTAVELLQAGATAKGMLDHLRKAIDPTTPQAEADEHYRQARGALQQLAQDGSLAVLCEAVPTFGAMMGGWSIGYDGTRFILTNTETGQAIDRYATDYVNSHIRAGEHAMDQLNEYFGEGSERLTKENAARELEERFWQALRDGRVVMKPGVRTIDIAERIRAGDFLGAKDMVEPVDRARPDAAIAALEAELASLTKLAGLVRGDADQVTAEMHRALAQSAAVASERRKVPAAEAAIRRAASNCSKVAGLIAEITADANGTVKGKSLARQSLDEIDERARKLASSDERTRLLAAYDKVEELVGKVSASARHARQLHGQAKDIIAAAATAREQAAQAQSAATTAQQLANTSALAAARAESAAGRARAGATELALRRTVVMGQLARLKAALAANSAAVARLAAMEARALQVRLTEVGPLDGHVAAAKEGEAQVKALLTSIRSDLAAIDPSGLCDTEFLPEDQVRQAEQAAKDAAERLAQSQTLREAVEAWKPGVKLAGGGRPAFSEGFEPALPEKPPGPRGTTRRPSFGEGFGPAPKDSDVVVDPPRTTPTQPERRPVEPPPPRPAPEEEIAPFYVVYGVHSIALDRLAPPEGVDPAGWFARLRPGDLPISAKPMGYIAFRVSGDVLKDYAAHRKSLAAGTAEGDFPLFAEGGRYHQMLIIHQGNKAHTELPVPLFMSFVRLAAERPAWVERTQFAAVGDKGMLVRGFVGELSDKRSLGGGWEFQSGRNDKAVAGPLVIDGTEDWGDKPRGAATKFIMVVGGSAAEAAAAAFR